MLYDFLLTQLSFLFLSPISTVTV